MLQNLVLAAILSVGQTDDVGFEPLTFDTMPQLAGTWEGDWVRQDRSTQLVRIVVEDRGNHFVVFWGTTDQSTLASPTGEPAACAFRVYRIGWDYHAYWGYVSFDADQRNLIQSVGDLFRGGPAIKHPRFPRSFAARMLVRFADNLVTIAIRDVQMGKIGEGSPLERPYARIEMRPVDTETLQTQTSISSASMPPQGSARMKSTSPSR